MNNNNNNIQNNIMNNNNNNIQNNIMNNNNNNIQNNIMNNNNMFMNFNNDINNINNMLINNMQNNFNFNNANNNQIPFPLFNINNQFVINSNNINNKNNDNRYSQYPITMAFTEPQKIGLQNVGATCYMNATLQCFCQIGILVDYFRMKPYIGEIISKYEKEKKLCLTSSFKYLVENLWPSNNYYTNNQYNHKNYNNRYFAPYKFKETISKMNSLFEGAQANDAKDLVNFIVMTLHEELNKAPKDQVNDGNILFIDQTNKKLILKKFLKNFAKENKSIISDIFYGVNFTSTQCSNCNEIKYNYQAYFFLIFPLEEVRKYKIELLTNQFMLMNQNLFNMNPMLFQQYLFNFKLKCQNINKVDINDCFLFNQKMEHFTGQNAMYCNNCKLQCPASYCTQLYTVPKILIIVLNRGKGIEFNVKLDFYEYLNLEQFVEIKKTGINYQLIGVVTHMGESGASGHFIAYCKSPIDGQWYKYNDDIVTKVNKFKEEIIDYAMPYILFFQIMNNNLR